MNSSEILEAIADVVPLHADELRSVARRVRRAEMEALEYSTSELPSATGQYLFAVDGGDCELWTLTAHGWFTNGTHYESPLERKAYTTWQRVVRGRR